MNEGAVDRCGTEGNRQSFEIALLDGNILGLVLGSTEVFTDGTSLGLDERFVGEFKTWMR